MPLQNRVTPEGEIVATPERGLFMGNRGGQIHRADRTLTRRRWTSRAWITCVLEFKGWRERIMADGRYTQLFFLDEATAFAAGHRPCALCRRTDYRRFQDGWRVARQLDARPLAPDIDTALHSERLTADRRKRTHVLPFDDLPVGTMVRHTSGPALVTRAGLQFWHHSGYAEVVPLGGQPNRVEVLTPPTIVAILRQGYRPYLHPSASLYG